MDDDDDEYDANEPGRVFMLGDMFEITRRVGRIGRPLHGNNSGVFVEIDADRNTQGIYAQFFQRTAEQYQESLQRARDCCARIWSEMNLPAATDDPRDAEAMERQIAAVAISFRTLAFRELVLYITFMSERPRGLPRLPGLSDPIAELSGEQEEALFRELEREEAFEGDSRRPGYAGLSNRERFQLHRERNGEVWSMQGRYWAGFAAE